MGLDEGIVPEGESDRYLEFFIQIFRICLEFNVIFLFILALYSISWYDDFA